MPNDKRNIKLPSEYVGAVLTEATRAYLYQGNPSAFIGRLLEGINHFCDETDTATDPASSEDRYLMTTLRRDLGKVKEELRQLESRIYEPKVGQPFDLNRG